MFFSACYIMRTCTYQPISKECKGCISLWGNGIENNLSFSRDTNSPFPVCYYVWAVLFQSYKQQQKTGYRTKSCIFLSGHDAAYRSRVLLSFELQGFTMPQKASPYSFLLGWTVLIFYCTVIILSINKVQF